MTKNAIMRALLLMGGLLLSLYACTPLPAPHTYYVSMTGNDSNDCLSMAHACFSLASAVSKATPQSQIDVGSGTFPSHVEINKWLTVIGRSNTAAGTFLIADSHNPVITVDNTIHFSITELTISGGGPIPDLTSTSTPSRVAGGSNGIEIHGNSIATQLVAHDVNIVNANYGILSTTPSAITLMDVYSLYDIYGVSVGGGTFNASQTNFNDNGIAGLVNASVAVLNGIYLSDNGINLSDPTTAAAIENQSVDGANGSLQITNNSYIDSNQEIGIASNGRGSVSISGTLISGNGGDGVDVSSASSGLNIDTSILEGNMGTGINSAAAQTQITRTAVDGNSSNGVVIQSGTAAIENSTILDNGSAGLATSGTNTTLSFDTLVGNSGPGLSVGASHTANVQNSIIALNGSPNCSPSIASVNLDASSLACNDAFLASTLHLADRLTDAAIGGAYQSMTYDIPLLASSPAIDHATGSCPAVDQRGYPRPYGPACDVGAYEFGSVSGLTAPGAGELLTAATAVTTTPTLPILQILTFTPSPAATDTPAAAAAPQLTFILNANCRKGPGSDYDVATSFVQGQTLDAAGRNGDSSWWLVNIPTGGTCWVGDSTVSKAGAVEQLSILAAPPLPGTPSKFVNTNVCDLKLKKLTVNVNWATVAGATGYNLYRDGSLLTTVGSGTTTYVDSPPLGAAWTYAVEALNSYGHSGQVTTSVPACT